MKSKLCAKLPVAIIATVFMFSCQQNSTSSKIVNKIKDRVSVAESECQRFELLDEEMRALLNRIRKENKGNREFIKKLNSSQAYWIPYMNSYVRALYPKDWDRYYRKEYGRTEFNECKCKDLSTIMLKRIEDLAFFLEPNRVDDDCPRVFSEK